jgi:hypothetical protein
MKAKAKTWISMGGLLFSQREMSHFDTHERLGSDPLSLGGTGDLRQMERSADVSI